MSDVDQNNVQELTVNGMEVRGKYPQRLRLPHHRAERTTSLRK